MWGLSQRYFMEKEMTTHSSILAWKSPWTGEPGGLQSMELHDWACVHEGGGRWVGSSKVVELKKKKKGTLNPTSCPFCQSRQQGAGLRSCGNTSSVLPSWLASPVGAWYHRRAPPRPHSGLLRLYLAVSSQTRTWFPWFSWGAFCSASSQLLCLQDHPREAVLTPGPTRSPPPQPVLWVKTGLAGPRSHQGPSPNVPPPPGVRGEPWSCSISSISSRAAIPNLFGTRDQFRGRQFFHGSGVGVEG